MSLESIERGVEGEEEILEERLSYGEITGEELDDSYDDYFYDEE